MSTSSNPVVVIGAGLAGALAATLMARRGHQVAVFERRGDLRKSTGSAGRSINLALSTRGVAALSRVGLEADVLATTLPMYGRRMHDTDGTMTYQPYGQDGQAIRSVSRRGLNEALLNLAAAEPGVTLHFNQRCAKVDLEAGVTTFISSTGEESVIQSSLIVGSDGVFSAVRDQMMRRGRFDYEQMYLAHGYKELTIPPTETGGFRIASDALHIWPRGDFMLIALPNNDGSFTLTLFQAFEGEMGLNALDADPARVQTFFERCFPDVLPHMPTLHADWAANPTSNLTTIRCNPFHFRDKAVLIGDAAHAIVPFYGQGMNAAFESAALFDTLLNETQGEMGDDFAAALPAFTHARKADADAIRQLALNNFMEMRAHVADPAFLRRKAIEKRLHEAAPSQFLPLYSMVTFSTIPYAETVSRAAAQDQWLDARLAAASEAGIADDAPEFLDFVLTTPPPS